ncbi:MAG: hypothetical protein HY785_16360 [Oscillatoriophycideae cyanobacterium NC_groundwater_1537_Pr4_S-0.65um_50_18]|nr:hypothetical protein [Oscillatoriophycideae cyanobacterium NC_groundwater_1537_Pr4_S-0.65um_50_18]
MVSESSSLDAAIRQLREVRLKLLRLHKALLESERITYEQFYGRISSSGEFFRLVVDHEWFNWLRPISQFIIQMDDVINAKEPVELQQVEGLLEQARVMLQPAEDGTSLEKRYYRAIQRDPDIAMMHGEISRLLAS